jgi:hypothetical protein
LVPTVPSTIVLCMREVWKSSRFGLETARWGSCSPRHSTQEDSHDRASSTHAGGDEDPQPVAGDATALPGSCGGFCEVLRRRPDQTGPEEIRRYQLHRVEEKKVSSSTINVTVCALRFLYRITLRRTWEVERNRHFQPPHPPPPRRQSRVPLERLPARGRQSTMTLDAVEFIRRFLPPTSY